MAVVELLYGIKAEQFLSPESKYELFEIIDLNRVYLSPVYFSSTESLQSCQIKFSRYVTYPKDGNMFDTKSIEHSDWFILFHGNVFTVLCDAKFQQKFGAKDSMDIFS